MYPGSGKLIHSSLTMNKNGKKMAKHKLVKLMFLSTWRQRDTKQVCMKLLTECGVAGYCDSAVLSSYSGCFLLLRLDDKLFLQN